MAERVAIVMTTVADDDSADALSHALVEARLAACVQRLLIRSTYRWDGEVRTEPEVLLLIKTTAERSHDVVVHLEGSHPYEVPEIVVVDDASASSAYLAWLAGSVGGLDGA